MIERKSVKRRAFAREILGLIAISALIALILFLVATNMAATVAEEYCFENDVPMTEFDWIELDRWIFGTGAVLSIGLFCTLFLAMLGERLAYIRKITGGIDAMRLGEANAPIPLEGNNELTELADAINYMSTARQEIVAKEKALSQEKEQFIRALSHDIRTPLTSILAYSDYLVSAQLPQEEQRAHLLLIRRKAEQIRDLTNLLLDGGKRNPEYFADGRLLMEQLAAEFEEELEEDFAVTLDLADCPAFAGHFDVQELRRIFDNLSSNVHKYADPAHPVTLRIRMDGGGLCIWQSNTVARCNSGAEGYQLGLRSIRRIAQGYGGKVTAEQTDGVFSITVVLSEIM